MPDLSTLGKRLKYARSQKRLFQKDVAAELGVTDVDVSRWESDKHVPGGDRLIELANLFGVPATWLIRGQGRIPAIEPVIANDVSRGTSKGPRTVGERIVRYNDPIQTPAVAGAIKQFEREATRLGGTDPELDHIHWALNNPESSRLFYLGDDGQALTPEQQSEELGYQIEALRLWLERRIARRAREGAAERDSTDVGGSSIRSLGEAERLPEPVVTEKPAAKQATGGSRQRPR